MATDTNPEPEELAERPRRLPQPNLWILTTILILLILLGVGLNSGYLASWWAGTLAADYPTVPFGKINKCLKLGQFSVGLLAIFELVAFPTFFKDAKNTFVWASGVFQLSRGIGRRGLRLTRKTIEDYLDNPEGNPDVPQIITRHVLDELHSEMDAAETSQVAKGLHALSKMNVSPSTIKALTFGSFIALTLADIFTG